MSTEVGSLQASLALDLSNFRAGMSEAATLAAQLGSQLQTTLNGNAGFGNMAREVAELIAQMEQLSGAVSSFQAAMNSMSAAEMFAAVRTHTAALPSEITSITSALQGANTAASELATSFENAHTRASNLAAIVQGMDLSALASGAGVMDFSNALSQLTQMHALMSQLIAQIQQFNTIDLNTGEVMGDGDQMPAFLNVQQILQEISSILERVSGLLGQCTDITNDWAQQMDLVRGSAERIASSLSGAATSMRGMRTSSNGAASGARNFATQTGKAEKNLQNAKGAAVSVKGILGGIIISQAFYSLLNVMEELVRGSLEFSKNMQDAGIAFEYLMKGQNVSSGAFLNALKDISLQSPLDTTDLTSSARKLMAMGFSAKATVPALQILTDTAAVFSNSAGDMSDMIDHISLAFGQMLASGKVSAQELRQLYNAGLPIYDLLADGLGITKEMAKNIGHYNVDSATAVYAVLDQLQKRYGGAASEMAETMSGAMEVIRESVQQLLAYSWADVFDDLTAKLNKLSKFLQALVKITQAYGPGGLFQAVFPESTWGTLRQLIGGFQMLGQAAKQLGSILATAFGGGLRIIVAIGAQVIPIVATIANTMLYIARAALAASPALRMLLAGLAALVIAGIVGRAVAFLAKAIYLLSGAKYAIAALTGLAKSMAALTGLPLKVVVPLMAIAAAFLAIVASSEKARAALAAFFGGVSDGFNSFAQKLGMGFDPGDIAMPEFEMPDTSDWSSGIEDMTEGMEDLEDATEGAGKAAKKNLQSFDEVFTIDPEDGGSGTDAFKDMMDSLKGLGGLDYSNMFDWTGDWATDWGTLSAGLGDLGSMAGAVFGDMSSLANSMWQSLADAFTENQDFAGGLVGGAIGAVIGAMVGHPKIGAAIGLLVGGIVGSFWEKLQERFGVSDAAGERMFDTSVFNGLVTGMLQAIIKVINTVFGKGAVKGLDDIWAGLTLAMSKEGIKALGKASTWKMLGSALKTGLKGTIISALAGIGIDLLTTWLVGWYGESIGKSAEEIARAEEWASWGSTILGIIGSIVGTIIAPGIGTIIGGLLGQLVGGLGGGTLGIFWDEIKYYGGLILDHLGKFFTEDIPNFFRNVGPVISNALSVGWNGVKTFFTETIPGWWDSLMSGMRKFFTTTVPNFFTNVGKIISEAVAGAWKGVKTFFTDTIPEWWSDFLATLKKFFTVTVPDAFYDAGHAIGTALATIIKVIWEFCTETIPDIWNDFIGALEHFFTVTIPNVWDAFITAIGKFFTTIKDAVVEFITVTIPNVWNKFIEALKKFFTETIPNIWNKFITAVGNFLKKIVDAVVTFFTKTLPDAAKRFISALKNFFTVTIPNIWNKFITAIGEFFKKIGSAIKTFFTETVPNLATNFISWVKNLGKRIIDGLIEGLKGAVGTVWSWIRNFGKGFIDGFKEVFDIHSPSHVTEWIGKMLMSGMEGGLADNVKQVLTTAMNAAKQITEALQPEETKPTDLLDGVTVSSEDTLKELTNWATTFITILASTFDAVAGLFDNLTERLNVATANIATVPSGINARMGSLSAVDNIGTVRTTHTGTSDVMHVLARLTEDTVNNLSNSVATRIYEYLAPLFATLSSDAQQQVIAYVGTLIADDRGLRELERKLEIIRLQENRR